MMKKKKNNIEYRRINFIASDTRRTQSIVLHPDLVDGLEEIAKEEKKSFSWLVETALAEYFGVTILLKKLKTKAKPAYRD